MIVCDVCKGPVDLVRAATTEHYGYGCRDRKCGGYGVLQPPVMTKESLLGTSFETVASTRKEQP